MYDNDVIVKKSRKGMVQIYTGNGKGKTTQALGQAFRALGHGKRVLMIQFMKKGKGLGEMKAARHFKRFKILQAGRRGWVKKDALRLKDKQLAQKGLEAFQKAIKGEKEKYDLVILDELNVALEFGLLQLEQVKKILKHKPAALEVVITGRYVHPEISKVADLVSEIRELKHYYKNGITARKGIEY